MNNRRDLESRIRAYLSEAARTQPPAGMEARLSVRVLRPASNWTLQLVAAAALVLVAFALGVTLPNARPAGGHTVTGSPRPSPLVSPLASEIPFVKPTVGPTQASANPYPLLPPVNFKMADASTGWAAGSNTDRILRTTDGGAHWNDVTPHGAPAGTWTTFFLDGNRAWLASSPQPGSGVPAYTVKLYRTSDGGQNWQFAGTVLADWGFPLAMDFVDKQHGWLLMKQDGSLAPLYSDIVAIFGTSDGGASWTKLSQTDTSGFAGHLPQACSKTNLVFVSITTGWIDGGCGPGGGYFLSVTRDGGRNWAAVALRIPQEGTVSCDCSIGSLRFWDSLHGAFVLNGAYQDARGYSQNYLYTTSDGGRSWQLGPLLPTNAFAVYFVDGAHAWTLDAKTNAVLFSGDAGRHWSSAGTIPTNSNNGVDDVQFVTAQIGWALGGDARGLPILKTMDGGHTWVVQLAP